MFKEYTLDQNRGALEQVEVHQPASHSEIQVLHDDVAEELAP